LTDYLTYELEKDKLFYQVGAAAQLNDNTFIFYGFGKNFKTTIINLILNNKGRYIGEEFFLLSGKKVFATIPNSHTFDLRPSHKSLMLNDLKNNKVNSAEYNHVIFLIYSKKNKIIEIDQEKANSYANLYQNTFNTYFYHNLMARDFFEGKAKSEKIVLTNKKARFFVVYFTAIENVFRFINKL